ncbi:MAG: toll/interleukin-1 receptor domain-containing protein [Magnetococcus sp. YQC-3]
MPDYAWDVFLSHSSEDKEIVTEAAERLRAAGLRVWFDADSIEVGDIIPAEIEEGLKGSKRLVLFMSPDAMASEWVNMERYAIYFRNTEKVKRPIIPVMLRDCEIPPLLASVKYLDLRTPNEAAWQTLLKTSGLLPTTPPATRKIQLDCLPTTSGKLFGRETRLLELDIAWETPTWNIWVLVADGGVGKTGLVVEWLNRLQAKKYAWAEWVFGWSFYSQGTREDRQVSSDAFFQEAFRFFGENADDHPNPRAKGRRLAELVGEKRGLLLLDGLEPLQYPPGEAHLGGLRDAGMAVFLLALARNNPGLCVVTTRVPVYELQDKGAVRQIVLEQLTPQAGAELLASYNLNSTQEEREAASDEYGGHALALNLLGSSLVRYCNGEIRQRDTIKALSDDKSQGRHAKKVMASYEIWLKDTPELALLHLMGLFDRPASEAEIRAVLGESPINHLTDQLPTFSSRKWQDAVHELQTLHLLSPTQNNTLDCHPLVREYFGGQLKTRHPDAWQEAHRRLFDYFCAIPRQKQPNTVEDLLPLYRALPHGCQAGLPQKALEEVYWKRIARGEEAYTVHKLGAYGLELGAMAAFFDSPWSQPAAGLPPAGQSFVLHQVALCLHAMGRLPEAQQAYAAAMAMGFQQRSWQKAATAANNLSQTHLLCADLPRAFAFAQLAVAVIDATEEAFLQMLYHTTHAAALHQHGAVLEATQLFQEAEARQQKWQPDYPLLYSLPGFRYNDLLLTQQAYRTVLERAEKILQWVTEQSLLLVIALDQLTLGQAHAGLGEWEKAGEWLDKALSGLERAGVQEFILRGLIARAGYYRLLQNWAKARRDMDEAWEISQRGGMRFYILQLHLEESQWAMGQKDLTKARKELDQAETMIQETGLFRFAPLADTIRAELGDKPRQWDREPMEKQISAETKALFKKYAGIPGVTPNGR